MHRTAFPDAADSFGNVLLRKLAGAEIAACLGLAEHEIELIRAEAVRLLQTSYFRDFKQPDTLNWGSLCPWSDE